MYEECDRYIALADALEAIACDEQPLSRLKQFTRVQIFPLRDLIGMMRSIVHETCMGDCTEWRMQCVGCRSDFTIQGIEENIFVIDQLRRITAHIRTVAQCRQLKVFADSTRAEWDAKRAQMHQEWVDRD